MFTFWLHHFTVQYSRCYTVVYSSAAHSIVFQLLHCTLQLPILQYSSGSTVLFFSWSNLQYSSCSTVLFSCPILQHSSCSTVPFKCPIIQYSSCSALLYSSAVRPSYPILQYSSCYLQLSILQHPSCSTVLFSCTILQGCFSVLSQLPIPQLPSCSPRSSSTTRNPHGKTFTKFLDALVKEEKGHRNNKKAFNFFLLLFFIVN